MPLVLVLEDNRSISDNLCQLIELLDVTARPVYTPRAAFLSMTEILPDLIFLDFDIPGADGNEILAYLRREPQLAKIPVVILTSGPHPDFGENGYNHGVLDVIPEVAGLETIENVLTKAGIL